MPDRLYMQRLVGLSLTVALTCLLSQAYEVREASAALPENCIDRLESKSGALISNIQSEMSRSHSRLENHYSGVQGAWKEFVRYFRGAWAAECLATHPQHKERFNAWLAANAQPVSNAAGAKLSEICTAYTDQLIQESTEELDAYLAQGSEAQVLTNARSFEGHLKRPIVAECKETRDKVKKITESYLPTIRNRAKLDRASQSFASRIFLVDSVLNEAAVAFASKGASLVEAPGVLTGSQGMADFARSLETCVDEAAKLRSFGADSSYPLKSPRHQPPTRLRAGVSWTAPEGRASMTLAEAEALCKDNVAGISDLFEQAKKHNEKVMAQRAKAWEKENLKGAGMRKVYAANGKRWPKVENLGSSVVWTYRSYTTGALTHECKEYVFSRGGALKNRKARLCN